MSKNRKILIAVIAAAAALILGGAYLLYQRYYGGAAKFDIESYPIVSYEYRKTASEHGIVADYLWMRIKELMLGKDGDSLFIPSSYMIAGRLSYRMRNHPVSIFCQTSHFFLRCMSEGETAYPR